MYMDSALWEECLERAARELGGWAAVAKKIGDGEFNGAMDLCVEEAKSHIGRGFLGGVVRNLDEYYGTGQYQAAVNERARQTYNRAVDVHNRAARFYNHIIEQRVNAANVAEDH
jgi:hypothetical protein